MRQRRHELEVRDGNSAPKSGAEIPHVDADDKEAPRVLDRSRPFAEVHGDDRGRVFEQDGVYYRADGTEADRE